MAGLLSQLVAFVRKNLFVLLVGVLALCYVYYNQGKSGYESLEESPGGSRGEILEDKDREEDPSFSNIKRGFNLTQFNRIYKQGKKKYMQAVDKTNREIAVSED